MSFGTVEATFWFYIRAIAETGGHIVDLEKIVELCGAGLAGGGAALVGLWAFAGKLIDAKVDAIKAKEIERFKGEINTEIERFKAAANKDLEQTRHALQLEYAQKSIVLQTQRPAFEAVLAAMADAITAVVHSKASSAWTPAPVQVYSTFCSVTRPHLLLIPGDGAEGVTLFSEFVRDCTNCGTELPAPSLADAAHAVLRLEYIRERMIAYFQTLVGLPVEGQPLRDLAVLAACRMLNHNDPQHGWPTTTAARSDLGRFPQQQIDAVLADLPALKCEVERFIQYVKQECRSQWLYGTFGGIEHLVKRLWC